MSSLSPGVAATAIAGHNSISALKANTPQKILIICHIFPPAAGIGGRRWAKFAKYLKRAGMQVRVLTSDIKTEESSTWSEDVRDIEVEYYPHKYPAILDRVPQSFIEKLSYRFWVKWLKLWTRGNIYDRALLIENEFYTALKKLLYSYKPDIVIATGAPFRILYYTSLLKLEFPEKLFAADLRDPWTWGHLYGYADLRGKKHSWELLMEARVMQRFDKIFTVSPVMVAHLQSCYKEAAAKIVELPHAFDADDMALIHSQEYSTGTSEPKIRVIYGGTLYEDLEDILSQLIGIAEAYPQKIEFNFFTEPEGYQHLLEYRPGNFTLRHRIAASQYVRQAIHHDAVLIFILPRFRDLVTTKILEIRAMGKPIVAIGAPGKAAEFIEEKGYGVFIETSDVQSFFSKLIAHEVQLPKPGDADLDNHSYRKVTEKLLQHIVKSEPVQEV